jgi:D-aminoacyl-tRNA deacylase
MRVVLQRVSRAEVRIGGRVSGSIGRGYVLLTAVSGDDTAASLKWMADKIVSLRLFPDQSDASAATGLAAALSGDAVPAPGGGGAESAPGGAGAESAPGGAGAEGAGQAAVPGGTSRNAKPSSFSRDISEAGGALLVVSQFTLYGNTRKGRRPSFIDAAPPEIAVQLYESFVDALRHRLPGRVETGEFGAMMEVELVNDGPVTLILERQPTPT